MTLVQIPRLETDRLSLRAPRLADFDAHGALLATERARYLGGPFDAVTAWRDFGADVGSWVLHGFGYWSIEERGSGAFVGVAGLSKPSYFPEREVGWILQADFEGRGYAFEAARAAIDYAFRTLGWPTLVSYIDHDNARSIALAERLGARPDPDAARPEPIDLVYRHSPERFAP